MQPSKSARTEIVQLNAYSLLANARAVTVSDRDRLEAKAQAGDLESETNVTRRVTTSRDHRVV